MTQWQLPPKKKTTGGEIKKAGKKNRYQMGRDFLPTHIGETKIKTIRTQGGNIKTSALKTNVVNLIINGKAKKAKIISVAANPANSQFVRRNVITKGAIIETDHGKARVTSRPGQSGAINAVLIEAKKS